MKPYYKELVKFVPHPLQVSKREDINHLWKCEHYPCIDIFEDFYECFQNAPDIRTSFFDILPIEEIHIQNGGLVFAAGHGNAYPIGIEITDLASENPRVKYQTHENSRWFSESISLRSFLFNVSAWQILHTMKCGVYIKLRYEKKFEEMVGKSLFFIAEDRWVKLCSNYRTCQNSEKNVLAVFNILTASLYLGANSDEILAGFIKANFPDAKLHKM